MKKKIYISGPVSGIENGNREAFAKAAKIWSNLYDVVNPMDSETEPDTWHACMRQDIVRLLECDIIAMLPGWQDSKGAGIEHFIARMLGMHVTDAITGTTITVPSMHERGGLYVEPEPITTIAHKLVHGDRRSIYGHPLDDYTRTAQLFSGILGIDVTAEQAILMMIAVKISRLTNTPDHRDSIIDVAGYAECLDLVRVEREKRAKVS